MLNQCKSKVCQAEPIIAVRRQISTIGMTLQPVQRADLSDRLLMRHLAGVASLAVVESDVRIAKHLIDVAYHIEDDH